MATIIAPFTAVDGNGNVRANAKLYFYMTGTTTPQNTFTDAALSVTATNPVVADSNGLFPAIYLGDPPTFSAYKAILKTSADAVVWTTDPIAGAPITAPISAANLRSYLAGLMLSRTSATVLGVAAGVCADSANSSILSLAAGSINCATVGADGLDAGALANSTWYHVHAIGKTDGTVARLASTSVSSPTMPSGYTLKRRIGSFKTNGSAQILDFTQVGDAFIWVAAVAETRSAGTFSLVGVPTGLIVEAMMTAYIAASASSYTLVYSSTVQPTLPTTALVSGVGNTQASGSFRLFTPTTAQIVETTSGASITSVILNTLGWIDTRGKNA